jgi:hypothetical protein
MTHDNNQVTTLKEQHAKLVDAKDQELKDLEKCHVEVEAIGKLNEMVGHLKTQLNRLNPLKTTAR